jgi:hypothetical protein
MRRRNFSPLVIASVLAMAVAGSGIAVAAQSGSSGAGAVAAKKKKKKKKKAAVTIEATVQPKTNPQADATVVNVSLVSKSSSCKFNRPVQVFRVADNALLLTEKTDSVSSVFAYVPIQPQGTQLQVKTPGSKSCKPGASAILTVT